MFQLFFNDKKVNSYNIARLSDAGKFKKMFELLLKENIYLPPSQFETEFISFAHNNDDLNNTVNAFSRVLKCL